MGLSFIFEVMTASIMTTNIDLLSFFHGYVSWVNSLTFWQFIGIISFVFVDLFRNVGKPIVLAIHQLIIKVRPLQFLSIENAQIKISILIPAHNEGASIRKTIESILENTYPNKEIVIIDDHSTDDTFQQAYPYYKKGLIKLVQRSQGVGSKSGAINFGIVFATGDVVLVMDGDTLLKRNALAEVAKFMTVSDLVAVAGNVRILSGDYGVINLLTKCQSYEYLIAFELGRRIRLMMKILVIIPGAFGAFRKPAVKKVGLFDKDTITEDFDLGIKIFKTGGRVEFVPNAVARTYCPNNWRAWMRQRIRWSHGQFRTLLKHRDAISGRTVYPFLFILGLVDMMFMDIVLLFVRAVSLGYIILTFQQTLLYPLILIMMIYLLNELIVIVTAALFSPDKSDLKYVYLAPVMIFIYRPVYACIRFYAYFVSMIKKDIKW
jgi:cellulose synthase/poly-beta-1,6-N-acetylglucosamine synthase-like glycosyltransferase